ncbi:MAG: glycosyltransferase family 4 protein [Firmicutes bacterium]|nr:glycosyltransferase family 4 protein [Dethiobacter sp.]MBS3888388.1 glycosyltransferase family 4 protein [Bacillota bacterium]MBS4054678.1 glycosyltransferase family 4 protein [Thermaerobacter sp.]
MNVMLITLYDMRSLQERGIYPDLMREFVANGHFVAVVSPSASSAQSGVTVHEEGRALIVKVPSGSIQKTGAIRKAWNTITLDTRLKRAVALKLSHIKFDVLLYSTPPVTLTQTIRYLRARDGLKTYLLLKDIFPQNAVDLGMMRASGLLGLPYRYFRSTEHELYRLSDHIGCMSPANVKFLLEQNPKIAPNLVEVCPNSIEPQDLTLTAAAREYWRTKYGLPHDKPIFIYGGNIGAPHGVEFIIECLKENEHDDQAFFVIVGAGTEYAKLQRYFELAKPRAAKLLPFLPAEDFDLLCAACDVGLIFLHQGFTVPNFPSRLLTYMQASLPILAATDPHTDLGEIIEGGKFGFWCESRSVSVFMQKVNLLCNAETRHRMGQSGRAYLENNYTAKHSYEIIMKHFAGGRTCSNTAPS